MSEGGLIYSLDSSALIDMVHDQPAESYPGLWKCMGALAVAGRLMMVENAYKECQDPEAQHWLREYECMRRPMSTEVLECVTVLQTDLANDGQYIEDPRSTKSQADPFVIGLAMAGNRSISGSFSSGNVVVVQHEGSTNLRTGKVKISDVCRRYAIRCFRLVELVRQEYWVFDLRGN